jgi:hypothetical protein
VAFLVLLLASFGGFGSPGPALAIAVFAMLVTALTLCVRRLLRDESRAGVVELLSGHRHRW